ncbi:MAG: hypothetical protein QOH15_1064, partial [Gaiellales bacterium]|nr:hypothetical protein [Gaiellales bacterium]
MSRLAGRVLPPLAAVALLLV